MTLSAASGFNLVRGSVLCSANARPLNDHQHDVRQHSLEIAINLEGKRVAILGGSSGIGLAVAQAAAGATAIIASNNWDRVEAACAMPHGAEWHAVDFTSPELVERLFKAIGPNDHLVYTAGENQMIGPVPAQQGERANERDVCCP